MRIGIIGFGSIGGFLAKKLGSDVAWIADTDEGAKRKARALGIRCPFFLSVPKSCMGADLVVEAAGQDAVRLLAPLLRECDAMVMSVGALADKRLCRALLALAKRHGRKIYIPSGAIGGLDAIGAVAEMGCTVLLETTKTPVALGRTNRKRTVVFEGGARQACRLFPKNVNVAATLALACGGFEKVRVRIISDPKAGRNAHRITARSRAGRMSFEFENFPSKENPKTSALAAMAALGRIKKIKSALQIG